MAKLKAMRGMQDFLGDDMARFRHVVARFHDVARWFGFRRVEVPVVEYSDVFQRTLGETTDVVTKEMYSFADRHGESLSLRPEFTAGICRAFITNGWQQHRPLKLVTDGPLFRYERPQKGRYRQFHQVDAEVLGEAGEEADIELIAFADALLGELGIGGVTLQLNTLGDVESRAAWREALIRHFAAHRDALSDDSKRRLEQNPLRILDSKEEQDRPLVAAAPPIDSFLTTAAGAFFERVQKGLDRRGVPFERAPRLVRGFDYYRHTAFEFVSDALGAQATVLGGGRYDGLVEAMGGPATPAVGWAGGVERLMLLAAAPPVPELVVVAADSSLQAQAPELVRLLCRAGIRATGAAAYKYDRAYKLAKQDGAARLLNVERAEDGAIVLRLRDLAAGDALVPVRARLLAALQDFAPREVDERRILLAKEF